MASVKERRQCQRPASLFVDCSNGVDRRLRGLAEQSLDDLMRRNERVPRGPDDAAAAGLRSEGQPEDQETECIPTRPYATAWLELLGELLHKRHEEASNSFTVRWMSTARSWQTLCTKTTPEAAERLA